MSNNNLPGAVGRKWPCLSGRSFSEGSRAISGTITPKILQLPEIAAQFPAYITQGLLPPFAGTVLTAIERRRPEMALPVRPEF